MDIKIRIRFANIYGDTLLELLESYQIYMGIGVYKSALDLIEAAWYNGPIDRTLLDMAIKAEPLGRIYSDFIRQELENEGLNIGP